MPIKSFISTFDATLDGKGRICVPASYRVVLALSDTPGLYCCPSFQDDAIDGFGTDVLAGITDKLDQQDVLMPTEYDDIAAAILPEIQNLPFDENGRVRLPDALIVHAGLSKKVTFAGVGRKFQIWDADRYLVARQERMARARELSKRRIVPAAAEPAK